MKQSFIIYLFVYELNFIHGFFSTHVFEFQPMLFTNSLVAMDINISFNRFLVYFGTEKV